MRVLLDNCVTIDFKEHLPGHTIVHATEVGWENLSNGILLATAERERFDVLITVDKNMRYQQNLIGKKISVITLLERYAFLPYIAPLAPKALAALEDLPPGVFITITPA